MLRIALQVERRFNFSSRAGELDKHAIVHQLCATSLQPNVT
jgi:hypothetical protein